jgi:PAS domain S-box-containing protein
MNLVTFPSMCYIVWFRFWRYGDRRKARFLGLGLAPFILMAYPQGLMVNWGLLTLPYLYSYAYLAFVMLMSSNLVEEAVQTAALSRRVVASEQRWRTLLEGIELMVAGIDRDGRFNYLNPHFLSATGYSRDELLGRSIQISIPKADVPRLEGLYKRIVEGTERLEPHSTNRIRRKDGELRTIHWSNVAIMDERGAVTGVLSVGADITDREQAEASRDKALQELEQIRHRLEAENLYFQTSQQNSCCRASGTAPPSVAPFERECPLLPR